MPAPRDPPAVARHGESIGLRSRVPDQRRGERSAVRRRGRGRSSSGDDLRGPRSPAKALGVDLPVVYVPPGRGGTFWGTYLVIGEVLREGVLARGAPGGPS